MMAATLATLQCCHNNQILSEQSNSSRFYTKHCNWRCIVSLRLVADRSHCGWKGVEPRRMVGWCPRSCRTLQSR
uniref:Uncharacterized protein n=1 Tax=Arundo donax TaxID=35708 RepID=A0A0A9D507_ARUDO